MGHYFKWLGGREQARALWENQEALDKYLVRLKEFWDEDKQEWKKDLSSDDGNNASLQAKKLSNENTSREI